MRKSKRRSNRQPRSPQPGAAAAPQTLRFSRRELCVVAILLLAGAGLRIAFPTRMAVEHFDEGVYASNIWFGAEAGYQYPMRRLYAPPLLPALIEWSLISQQANAAQPFEPSALAVMAPSLIAGCLTLLVVWWIAREWFGAAAGMAVLALAAFSDFHLLYSRAALTESLLGLFLLAAVWALQRALATYGWRFAAIAAVFTGLAWWTKYNGWLPLAIALGGIGLAVVADREQRKEIVKLAACWTGIAAGAFVFWSPYLAQLQPFGGYAEIAANHQQYVVGFSGWLSGLQRQYANLSYLDAWPTYLGILIAVLRVDRFNATIGGSALAFSALAIWLGSPLVLLLMSVIFFVITLPNRNQQRERIWPVFLLAAWIGGLLLATPLYHPYPRLTLPLLCGLWIAGGAGISTFTTLIATGQRTITARRVSITLGAIAALAFVLAIKTHRIDSPAAWQDRTGWRPVAAGIVAQVAPTAESERRDPSQAIVYIYGEPALLFHLNAVGTQLFLPTQDLGFVHQAGPIDAGIPRFLAAGPHADRTPAFVQEFLEKEAQLKLVAKFNYEASDLVLLNDYPPRELAANAEAIRTHKVRLYRVLTERVPNPQ